MLLPPIIERELRTASKRGMTYWTRLAAGAVALLAAGPVVLAFEFGAMLGAPGGMFPQLGPILFWLFSAAACFTSLTAGLFFASDALARERREGTLELLFLAPLRPWEVVFGKLATVTWRGTQWLLAAAPLFAMPILLGGVQGQDFVRLICIAANTLFWSMATNLWCSARTRETFQAVTGALVTQALLMGTPFLGDWILSGFDSSAYEYRLSLLSPIYAWTKGFGSRSPEFWSSLALMHAEAWLFLLLTVRATARDLRQDPSGHRAGVLENFNRTWNFGGPKSRASLRRSLLDLRPIRWLVERERGPARFLRTLLILFLASALGVLIALEESTALPAFGSLASALLSIIIALLLALQSCRFLVEARRTGALELLLVSPISSREILYGQFHSLYRIFGLPIAVLLVTQILVMLAQWQLMSGTTGSLPPGTPSAGATIAALASYQWLSGIIGIVISLTGYFTLIWVGLWMGLACRQVSTAFFATLGIAKVIPFFALAFAQGTIMPPLLADRIPAWSMAVASGIVGIGLNLGLIALARYQLLPDLRRILDSPTHVILPARSPKPPPILAT